MTLLEFIENHYWSLWFLAAFTIACITNASKVFLAYKGRSQSWQYVEKEALVSEEQNIEARR